MPPIRALKHMFMVDVYRQRLESLQGVWDTLSLLSHMGGDGTDLSHTRAAFEKLAAELVNHLSDETWRKCLRELSAKAQVAIDVLVRNLFERTADIGFLCADDDIRAYFEKSDRSEHDQRIMRLRLKEYVQKYTVYSNVVLLAPDGEILTELLDQQRSQRSTDPLLAETLNTSAGFVETYRRSDLVPGDQAALIYSFRVMSGHRAVGVLCLCFDFASEVHSIFSKLHHPEDWTVLTWLDRSGRVIASSDPLQIPEGMTVPMAEDKDGKIVRLAGREYLAITRPSAGYQGYPGPGWYGHAMVPLEHAFEQQARQRHVDDPVLLSVLSGSTGIFTDDLSKVTARADAIQRELNRSVWNGNVRLTAASMDNNTFAKALLKEISSTGEKTKDVFARSIGDLHQTVLSSILEESRFIASLAVEIMDRNLYERANDCRWWALNGTLRDSLEGRASAEQATNTLVNINQLYTVYDNLVLFDRECRVIAVSNPNSSALVGQTLSHAWAKATLGLLNSQQYAVSPFEVCDLYDHRHTYVFAAAIRNQAGRIAGGIGIVFDSAPQFRSLLHDVLPQTVSNTGNAASIAVLADAQGKVISATARYQVGEQLKLPPAILNPPPDGLAQMLTIDGQYYAIGACRTTGYREFNGVMATALIIEPIGTAATNQPVQQQRQARPISTPARGRPTAEMATFFCAGQWYAVPAAAVIEAIDQELVTRMPGLNHGCTGIIRFREQIVPLIDLAQVLTKGKAASESIIIIRTADQQFLGLQVDALGDVVEAPVDCIVSMAETMESHVARLAVRIVRPDADQSPLFLMLDPDTLTGLLRSPQAPRLRA